MLAPIRRFTDRVRQRSRIELALVVVLGLCGMAMSGTGQRAYVNQEGAPLFQRPAEGRRVARLVIVAASAWRRPLAVEAPTSAPAPAVPARRAAWRPAPSPHLNLHLALPAVRGPPRAPARA